MGCIELNNILHLKHPYIEVYVFDELKVVGVHSEVVHDEGVVHVVGEMSRNGEVTETHHLLGGVDDDRVVDAGPVWLWILLQEQPRGEKNNYCYFPPK